ncbi:S53 family peptidase [Alicyclobacillus dauci]|uniref:S53 family peptidase n=1 Tax=Alicyclobacillus dauci TaxID=1475485 RepID=A0ABY6Z191_9BACL|nr:S53 family peptidase [Alicyclobacillus dauci]WAH35996.1 S53 family peptidase [Alicyclobacillus dauci]
MLKRELLLSTRALVNNGQGYYPSDIRRAYHFPINYQGSGQTIGILEFSNGYRLRDAKAFWNMHGITPPTVEFVSVDGTRNDQGRQPQDEEASLDLQWAGALAPQAKLVVYEANAGDTYAQFAQAMIRTLTFILNDTQRKPSVLSISYGDAEESFSPNDLQRIARVIQKLDNTGITVCVASGDQGAYGLHDLSGSRRRHVDAPASVPNAIAVGGTHLNASGGERAWTYYGPQNGGATGGGYSSLFAKPTWQKALPGVMRALPDIAFNADPASGYQIVFQGDTAVVGGTSVSCPVFAAIVALANEARAFNGKPPVANLGQILYSNTNLIPFRDVIQGNNSFNGVTGYTAKPGWDACTGLGSLDVASFIAFLATHDA